MPPEGYDVVKPNMFQGGNILPDSIFRWFIAWVPFKLSTFILVNTTIILVNTLVMFSMKIWNKWRHGHKQQTGQNSERTSKSKTSAKNGDSRQTKSKHKTNGSPTKSTRKLFPRKHLKGQDRKRKLNRIMKHEREDGDYESLYGGGATLDEITWLSSTDESAFNTTHPPAGQVSSNSCLHSGCKHQNTFRSMPPDYKFGTLNVNEIPLKYHQHKYPQPIIKNVDSLPIKPIEDSFQLHASIYPNGCYPAQYPSKIKNKRKKLKKHFRRLSKSNRNRSPHKSKTQLLYSDIDKFNPLHYSPTRKQAKSKITKSNNIDLVSSMTSVWSNSVPESKVCNPHSVPESKVCNPHSDSSENQAKSNKSELSINLNRDSWIWFSPITQAGVEDFTTRQRKFRSTDPRVPQIIAEIRRQDQMNKDILREANSLVEEVPEKQSSDSVDKNERSESYKPEASTKKRFNRRKQTPVKQTAPSQTKRNLPSTFETRATKLQHQMKEQKTAINLQAIPTPSSQINLNVPSSPQLIEKVRNLTHPKNNEGKPIPETSKAINKPIQTSAPDKRNSRRNPHRFNQSKVDHEIRSAPEKIRGEGVINVKADLEFNPINNSPYFIPNVSCSHGDGHLVSLSPTRRPVEVLAMNHQSYFPNASPLKIQSTEHEVPNVGRKRLYRTRSEFDLQDSSESKPLNTTFTSYKVKPSVSCVFYRHPNKRPPDKYRKVSPERCVDYAQQEAPTVYTNETKETRLRSPTDPVNIVNDRNPRLNINSAPLDICLNHTPAVHIKEESESDSFFVQSSSLDNSTTKATAQIGQEVSRTIKNLIFKNDSNSSDSTHNKIQPEYKKKKSVSPKRSPSSISMKVKQVSFTNKQNNKQTSDSKSEPSDSRIFNNKHPSPSTSPKRQHRKSVFSPKYYLGKRAKSNLKKYGINREDSNSK